MEFQLVLQKFQFHIFQFTRSKTVENGTLYNQLNIKGNSFDTYLNNKTAYNHIRKQVSIEKIVYEHYPNPIIPIIWNKLPSF